MDTEIIDQISSDENDYMARLHKIVEETIREEGLILHNLLHPPKRSSRTDKNFPTRWPFREVVGNSLSFF